MKYSDQPPSNLDHAERRISAISAAVATVGAKLQAKLPKMKIERNTFVKLHQAMPTELFENILFWACVGPYMDLPRSLKKLSCVCKRWRDIIKNTPRLWHTISSDYALDMVRVFLRRSGNAPIRIRCRDGREDDFLTAISSSSARWVSLEYFGAKDACQTLLSLPTPMLCSFSCIIHGSYSSPITLPQSACLQKLMLRGVNFEFSSFNLSNLKVLDIIDLPRQTFSSPAEFHSFLSACPKIESLSLHSVALSDGTSVDAVATLPQLDFGRLRSLTIIRIQDILSNIILRSTFPPHMAHFEVRATPICGVADLSASACASIRGIWKGDRMVNVAVELRDEITCSFKTERMRKDLMEQAVIQVQGGSGENIAGPLEALARKIGIKTSVQLILDESSHFPGDSEDVCKRIFQSLALALPTINGIQLSMQRSSPLNVFKVLSTPVSSRWLVPDLEAVYFGVRISRRELYPVLRQRWGTCGQTDTSEIGRPAKLVFIAPDVKLESKDVRHAFGTCDCFVPS